jgi:hypothetical protein
MVARRLWRSPRFREPSPPVSAVTFGGMAEKAQDIRAVYCVRVGRRRPPIQLELALAPAITRFLSAARLLVQNL